MDTLFVTKEPITQVNKEVTDHTHISTYIHMYTQNQLTDIILVEMYMSMYRHKQYNYNHVRGARQALGYWNGERQNLGVCPVGDPVGLVINEPKNFKKFTLTSWYFQTTHEKRLSCVFKYYCLVILDIPPPTLTIDKTAEQAKLVRLGGWPV